VDAHPRTRPAGGTALAILLAAAGLARAEDVALVVRSPGPSAGPVACRLRDAGGQEDPERLRPGGSDRWAWRVRAGDVVGCRGPGVEPLDVDSRRFTLGREVTLPMKAARPVVLETAWAGIDAVLEWRSLVPPLSSLVAADRTVVSGRLTLPVASAVPRVIRLRPGAGLSPVSVLVPAGGEAPAIRVPPPAPGGELLAFLPRHAFLPEAVELAAGGKKTVLRPVGPGLLQAIGLAPGEYSLVPRYAGGLAGRSVRTVVRTGETSELLPLPLEEPGAASILAGAPVCGEEPPAWLSLRRVTLGAPPGRPLLAEPLGASCRRELEGLAEGDYVASALRGGGDGEVAATAVFRVAKGERTEVELVPPAEVSGRFTFGGERPAPRLHLQFDLEGRRWTAETDEYGEYAVRLGEPGDYVITVRASRKLPATQWSRRFRAGEQREDFELGEALVEVRAYREDHAPLTEPVQVWLTAADGRRRINGAFDPAEEEAARFVGIEYGEYAVTASTPSGLTSVRSATVRISPDSPVGEADAVLGRHRAVLRVVDGAGAPLAGSRALVDRSPLASPSPGVFALEGVAVGDRVVVQAPGHVPLCRVLREQDLPEVRLVAEPASETLTLRFPRDAAWETGVLLGLRGSDCPVGLGDLEPTADAGSGLTTVRLRLSGGRYDLLLGGRAHPVAVPGEADILP